MYKTLIVDDEPELLDVLSDWFRDHGHEVVLAADGSEAIQLIHEVNPDLVITDLKMKSVDGMQVLVAAKEHDPLMPVILMTGHWTNVRDAVHAMKMGADDYICKPFELKELDLKVIYALESRKKLEGLSMANTAGITPRLVKLSQLVNLQPE